MIVLDFIQLFLMDDRVEDVRLIIGRIREQTTECTPPFRKPHFGTGLGTRKTIAVWRSLVLVINYSSGLRVR
jgi:hypothetical protein